MTYSRIESMGRSASINDGVAAPTADPLWMLGRQWQLGELTGDDAAQPAAVRVRLVHAPLDSFRREGGLDGAAPGPTEPMPTAEPLEADVERAPLPDAGPAAVFLAAEMGERLRAQLRRVRGGDELLRGLRERFPLEGGDDAPLVTADAVALRLLRRRGVDGRRLAALVDEQIEEFLGDLVEVDADDVLDVWRRWRAGEAALGLAGGESGAGAGAGGGSGAGGGAGGGPERATWRPHRFEHRFSVEAVTGGAPGERLQLQAPEYAAGRLDWFSFDVAEGSSHTSAAGLGRRPRSSTIATIPAPVTFAGMPASRWWEFEDGEIMIGDLDAGPGDLARLAVAEFATVYNDDWFVVPVRLRRGELVRVDVVQVFDTFDREPVRVRSSSTVDRELLERHGEDGPPPRPWRFFELHGDAHLGEGRAPWMLVPPSLGSTLHGPDLERVVFGRDEDANLAWAIERIIEGPLGRPIDRARAVDRSEPEGGGGGASGAGRRRARRYGEEYWRWDIESSPPPWWIPLIPDRDDPQSEQVVLRRARMATWADSDRRDVGPKGTLLEPDRPFFVREEEVPRSGATVRRQWQWTRWEDGSTHLWLQRSKQNGRGERSSGLVWDALLPEQDPPGS